MKRVMDLFLVILCVTVLTACGSSRNTNEITLNHSTSSMMVGQSIMLEAAVTNEGDAVLWSVVGDAALVELAADGLKCAVTAKSAGTVSIRAASAYTSADCTLIISAARLESGLTDDMLTLSLSVRPTCRLEIQNPFLDEKLTYQSQNETIAKVSHDGLVCGLTAGETAITVTHPSSSTILQVSVKCTGQLQDFPKDNLNPTTALLTLYDSASTIYGITWHAMHAGFIPVVQYVKGRVDASDSWESEVSQAAASVSSFSAKAYNASTYTDYTFKAQLTGLEPDTEYTYRFGDYAMEKWSEPAVFKTKRSAVDSFTFIHITDSQEKAILLDVDTGADSGRYAFDALTAAFKQAPDAELLIHGGDMTEYSEYETSWRRMLDKNRPFFTSVPVMMAAGNHDTTYQGAKQTMQRHFNIDYPDQNMDYGAYYSFDYGDVHFTVLNTNVLSGNALTLTQMNWLEQDLSQAVQPWIIVVMHNPIYSPAKWGSGIDNAIALALRGQLLNVFDEYNVDMVLQGHDHVYLRTHPIDGNGTIKSDAATTTINGVEYYVNPEGIVFHMAATSGGSENAKVSGADMSYYAVYAAGKKSSWSEFHVANNTLTVKSYYDSGVSPIEYDVYGIQKA